MDVRFSEADLDALRRAHALLENPGLTARLTSTLGSPIEKGLRYLPDGWHKTIGDVTRIALMKAADTALFTLDKQPGKESSNLWHKVGVAVTGGVGGFFGLAGLAVELPISTTLMMRSIADIARSEGEHLDNPQTRLACLEVFALGGNQASDDATESGYYAVRALLAQAVSQAVEYAGGKVMLEKAAPPAMARLVSMIAERFGIQITEKAAAQAVPAIGAAGGALINTLFIDHFQDMARGHFIIRRLESVYGQEAVEQAYAGLSADQSR
ncbi:EcsC family protein [Castellaniella sp.]|uniref:EcsC family protein n=1 Tax=Castellaniella sp. TaxID=1955812 RepID=UPI002AFE7694|nr:EcsC family protein [Castellaniella sp.]